MTELTQVHLHSKHSILGYNISVPTSRQPMQPNRAANAVSLCDSPAPRGSSKTKQERLAIPTALTGDLFSSPVSTQALWSHSSSLLAVHSNGIHCTELHRPRRSKGFQWSCAGIFCFTSQGMSLRLKHNSSAPLYRLSRASSNPCMTNSGTSNNSSHTTHHA